MSNNRHHLVGLILLVLSLAPAWLSAAEDVWIDAAGGVFDTNSNWADGSAPTVGDAVLFGLDSSYLVQFTEDETTDELTVSDGVVTFFSKSPATYTYHVSGGTCDATIETLGELRLGWSGSALDLDVGDYLAVRAGGRVLVQEGSLLTTQRMGIAAYPGADDSLLRVDGAGSRIEVTGSDDHYLGRSGAHADLEFANEATASIAGTLSLAISTATGSSATMLVESNADVTLENLALATGGYSNQTADLTVTGNGSTLTQTGSSTLTVGANSVEAGTHATITVAAYGDFTTGTGTTTIRETGTVEIDGGEFCVLGDLDIDGGRLTCTSGTLSWSSGRTMTIQNGGQCEIDRVYHTPTDSTIDVHDAGSLLRFMDAFETGTFCVDNGADVSASAGGAIDVDFLFVGSDSAGTVTVTGSGTSLTASATHTGFVNAIGKNASGTLMLSDGATGVFSGNVLRVGAEGGADSAGLVEVSGGATLSVGDLDVGTETTDPAASGTVTLTGTGSTIEQIGSAKLTIGGGAGYGSGTLNVLFGGTYTTGTGTTTIQPTGCINLGGRFELSGDLDIDGGQLLGSGTGSFAWADGCTMTIRNGGRYQTPMQYTAPNGSVTDVHGSGSLLGVENESDSATLSVRNGAEISVTDGGALEANFLFVGQNATGTVVVDGAGTSLTVDGTCGSFTSAVGNSAAGTLMLTNGATGSFSGHTLCVGDTGGSNTDGVIEVTAGATLSLGDVKIGTNASDPGASGRLTVSGPTSYINQPGEASLTIGGAAGSGSGSVEVLADSVFWTGTGVTTVAETGTVHVDDNGDFEVRGDLDIDGGQVLCTSHADVLFYGSQTMTIHGGGRLEAGDQFGAPGGATIDVHGTGSLLRAVSSSSRGTLYFEGGSDVTVRDGGAAEASFLHLGGSSSPATMTVTGTGTSLAIMGTDDDLTSRIGYDTSATLTLTDGATGVFSGHVLRVGPGGLSDTEALVEVSGGATLSIGDVEIGTEHFTQDASSTVTVTGTGSTIEQTGPAELTIGSEAGTGSGTINVLSGGTFAAGAAAVTLNPAGTINVIGGTCTLGSVANQGGSLNFVSGSLGLGSDLVVGVEGLLGAGITLEGTRALSVAGTTTVHMGSSLAIEGGRFSTGSLQCAGTLTLESGTFSLTDDVLTVDVGGLFGSRLAMGSGQTIDVTNGTTVAAGGRVEMTGGCLSGGPVTNEGVIFGSGELAGPLNNAANGEVRVAAGERLLLSGQGNTNAGKIEAIAGEIEFTRDMTNQASTGLIAARDARLRFTGGLTNAGTLALSFGTSDVFGDIDNTSGASVVVSGQSRATFYDDIDNQGEVRVSDGAVAVFFGSFSGEGVTCAGTCYFEGDLRPGHSPGIMAFGGDVCLRSTAELHVELADPDNTDPFAPRYDALDVAGDVELAGALSLEWLPIDGDPTSAFGGAYTLLAYGGTRTGTFDRIGGELAAYLDTSVFADGIEYDDVHGEVRVHLYDLVDGDANLNGLVERDDLLALRVGHDSGSGGWSLGDFNFDGLVNAEDYLLWKANVGARAGGAVPEPMCLALLLAGSTVLLRRRRR